MYTILTKKSCTLNYIIHLLHRVWQVRAQVSIALRVEFLAAVREGEAVYCRCSVDKVRAQLAPSLSLKSATDITLSEARSRLYQRRFWSPK